MRTRASSHTSALAAALGVAVCALVLSVAADPPGTAVPALKGDRHAAELLSAAARFLGRTAAFECTIREREGGKSDSGQGGQARLALMRPKRFKVVTAGGGTASTAPNSSATCDGLNLFNLAPSGEVVRAIAAPEKIGDLVGSGAIPARANVIGAAFGLLLLADDFDGLIIAEATEVKAAGRENTNEGATLEHVQAVCPERIIDIWIDAGERPLVRRARVTPVGPDGTPGESWVEEEFADWKIDANLREEEFSRAAVAAEMGRADGPKREPHAAHSLVGKPAESLALEMLDGGSFDLAKHRGKEVVVLDFWATWCGPCVRGLPTVMETVSANASKGVVLYAVNRAENAPVVQKFVDKRGWSNLNIPLDDKKALGHLYAVRAIPQTVIINRQGIITAVHVGIPKDLGELKARLQREIDAALGG